MLDCTPVEGGRLPKAHLRLAVIQALHDGLEAEAILDRLWREDAEVVEAEACFVRSSLTLDALDYLSSGLCGRHGLHAERMRELHRPLPVRDKHGLTMKDIAARAGLERETLACLMEHHGYLELVPYGGGQRRRLVTDQAFAAGLGHNVDGARIRVARLEGMNRAAPFPVFYEEGVEQILWTLDHEGITARVAAMPNKRARLRWLLTTHAFLPNAEIARLSGCSLSGVKKAAAGPAE